MPETHQNLTRFLQSRMHVQDGPAAELVPQLLQAMRSHLGLDIAFVSRFGEGRRVLQYVEGGGEGQEVAAGMSDPLEESYCQRIVDGRLPELIPDVNEVPEARRLPVTQALNVGSYVGVPLRMSDGSVYGTFCCIGKRAEPTLGTRDLELLRVFADIAAQLLERDLQHAREAEEIRLRTHGVLDQGGLSMVYQPIRNLSLQRTVGVEALARFAPASGLARSPDDWFNQAARVGLGPALELRAIEMALAALEFLPADVYVSCNVSPSVALDGALPSLLRTAPLERVVLEITEHASVSDYEALVEALAALRRHGLRVAVDDAGAGYASFRHILMLRPDIIKLDMSLTRDIDKHDGRRALAAALIRFAEETGSQLVAEGVETEAELQVLQGLRAGIAQGYLFGRPMPLDAMREFLEAEERSR